MSRNELLTQASQTLTRLRLLEKKAANRKPKVERAAAELVEARKEALRKVEEDHKRKTGKLLLECAELDREISLAKKRYVELQSDVVRVTDVNAQAREAVGIRQTG